MRKVARASRIFDGLMTATRKSGRGGEGGSEIGLIGFHGAAVEDAPRQIFAIEEKRRSSSNVDLIFTK